MKHSYWELNQFKKKKIMSLITKTKHLNNFSSFKMKDSNIVYIEKKKKTLYLNDSMILLDFLLIE